MRSFNEEAVVNFYDEAFKKVQATLPFDPRDVDPQVEFNEDTGAYVLEFHVPLVHGYGTVSSYIECEPPSDMYRLVVRYKMTTDRHSKYLTVGYSKFEVRVVTTPGIRFEYERAKNNVPAAHIHLSGVEGLLSPALMRNFSSGKGKAKKKRSGDLAGIHLPVGGHRFRPSLEDFLYFVVEECGFRALHGWESHLLESREEWFDIQLASSVRDNPEVAADALRTLGYAVDTPFGGPPEPRMHQGW